MQVRRRITGFRGGAAARRGRLRPRRRGEARPLRHRVHLGQRRGTRDRRLRPPSAPVAGSPFAAGTYPCGRRRPPDGLPPLRRATSRQQRPLYEIAASGALTPVAGSPFAAGDEPLGVAATPTGATSTSQPAGDNVPPYESPPRAPCPGRGLAVRGGRFPVRRRRHPRRAPPLRRPTRRQKQRLRLRDRRLRRPHPRSSGSPFAAGDPPAGVAATPDGRHLYVANPADSSVSAHEIAASGALTPVVGLAVRVRGPGRPASPPPPTGAASTSPTRRQQRLRLRDRRLRRPSPRSRARRSRAGSQPGGGRRHPRRGATSTSPTTASNVSAHEIAASGAPDPGRGLAVRGGRLGPTSSLAITPDQPPVAAFTVSPAEAGEASAFDASATTDADGTPARFDWDFGDGTALRRRGPTPTHTYATPGDLHRRR